MTDKQNLIITYLNSHDRQGYYIDIRENVATEFDDENDFDKTLYQLINLNIIYENDDDTLYKLVPADSIVKG